MAPIHAPLPAGTFPPLTSTPMAALKSFAGYLALSTVVPFAMLLSLEGFASMAMMAHEVATAAPPPRLPLVAHDTLLGWIGRPNVSLPNHFGPNLTVTHDENGMRVHRAPTGTPASSERGVVCSGGGLVYGAGVADSGTMCAYLERELPGVRTLNMAQRGFGVSQAYLWYRRDGARHPHRLHVFAFGRGDFDRMARESDRGYAKPVLELRDGQLVVGNAPLPIRTTPSRWWALPMVLSDSRLMHAVERRTGRTESRLAREGELSLRVSDAMFRDLDRLNRERGSRVVLVYLPVLADLKPGPNDERRAAVESFGRQSGIPFVDLTASMRAVPADTADWFFITPNALPSRGVAGHYSAAGHRWVAARLAERLRETLDVARALEAAH